MTRPPLRLLFPLVLGLSIAAPASPVAQFNATAATSIARDGRLDLAAMALDANDLPEDYRTFEYAEGYYTGDEIAAGYEGTTIRPEEVTATGLRWFYESYYRKANGQSYIRVYVEEFDSPDGAIAGFNLLEDDARWAEAFAPDSDLRDVPAVPSVGEQPTEVTVGTIDDETGWDLQFVDVTFRVGRLLAGVAIDASPSQPPPDEQLARDLAAKLEARIRQVLAGTAPASVNLALPGMLLPIDKAWPAGYAMAGHLTAAEALGNLKPLQGFQGDFRAGYARTVAIELPSRLGTGFVTVSIIELSTPPLTETVLKLAEFLPRTAPLQYYLWEPVTAPEIPGVTRTAALQVPYMATAYRVSFVTGKLLATVAVENLPDAKAVALDLAQQQADCLRADAPCQSVSIPSALQVQAQEATPAASPRP